MSILPIVKQLIDTGWAVVPIDPGSKGLETKGWLKKAKAHGFTLADFKDDSNVGVVPGPCSGHRVNVDLDSEIAVRVGNKILPETDLIHGRASKPRSHMWYRVEGAVKRKYIDPVVNTMLLEVQVENGQTVMPPSTHPSGEAYEYYAQGEPTVLDDVKFSTACDYTAITTLLATYWPRTEGSRHDLALCTAGFLAKHITQQEVLFGLMETIFEIAGDSETRDRMLAIRTTLANLAADNKTTGEPTFREKFPQGDAIANAINKWLSKSKKPTTATGLLAPTDFIAFLPEHKYFLVHNAKVWDPQSIRSQVKSPTKMDICAWLDRDPNSHVHELTWSPGEDAILRGVLVVDTGRIHDPKFSTLNLYRPPTLIPVREPGVDLTAHAKLWLDHLKAIYEQDMNHLIGWFAWRIQRPEVKINHGIVLGGKQGIGKDTILVPIQEGVGSWNFTDVQPDQIMGRFNGYLKAVVMRVNEARDLGDATRWQLYERCKSMLAAPPEYFRVDEKNLREHPVRNVVGVIFTTNSKEGGLYLPDDDRRHYVAWSERTKESFAEAGDVTTERPQYFKRIHQWYEKSDGIAHVVAYLRQPHLLDLIDPKAPPPHTEAWHHIVGANRSPEEAELHDLIDRLHAPDVVTIQDLIECCMASGDDQSLVKFADWLADKKNSRAIPHRLEAIGYTTVENKGDQTGKWKLNGRRTPIYAKVSLQGTARMDAVRKRVADSRQEVVPGGLKI